MNFDVPLAAGAVRLAVLRLTDTDSDKLATAVSAATDFILNELPEGDFLLHLGIKFKFPYNIFCALC